MNIRVTCEPGANEPTNFTGNVPLGNASLSSFCERSTGTGSNDNNRTPSIVEVDTFLTVADTVTSPGTIKPSLPAFNASGFGVTSTEIDNTCPPTASFTEPDP